MGLAWREKPAIGSIEELAGLKIRISGPLQLTPDLQNALMESAYQTQVFIQLASEAALVNTVGASNPQTPNTVFGKHGIRFVELPEKELKKAEHLCSPEFNPKPWEGWREKLNKMAGNIDIYKEIHAIARQIPSDSLAENVEPRRWWKAL
jgi:hypothetical protein